MGGKLEYWGGGQLQKFSGRFAPEILLPSHIFIACSTPGCSLIEAPKKRRKNYHPKCTAKSRIWGAETPEPIATKFCMSGAVQDVMRHANFGEDRLRGFGVARGRILAFSTDLLRRL